MNDTLETRRVLKPLYGQRVYVEGFIERINEADKGGYRVLLSPVFISKYGTWKEQIKLEHVWVYNNQAESLADMELEGVTRLTKIAFLAEVTRYIRSDDSRDYGLDTMKFTRLNYDWYKGLSRHNLGKTVATLNSVEIELQKLEQRCVLLEKNSPVDLDEIEHQYRDLRDSLVKALEELKSEQNKNKKRRRQKRKSRKSTLDLVRAVS